MNCNINNKIKCILLGFAAAIILCGCKQDTNVVQDDPVEILLITDYGTVNDGSFNQGAWSGIQMFAEETGKACDYYQPVGTKIEDFMTQVKRGVKNGAQVIICPGYLHERTVFEAQSKYPDVKFVLVDGQPHNEDYSDTTIGNNTVAIIFAEEQVGFLAGYSAVREGYTRLGFMGGVPEDAVIRYGYGFVQGADYAAIEMGVEVHIRYAYMNTFSDDPIAENTAAAWFDDDTEVIFACGGEIGKGIMRAAENHYGKVIGVDINQGGESQTVITSAMKSISESVYTTLKGYESGNFEGGKVKTVTAAENGVRLPMDSSRFERFTVEDYDSVYERLVDGMIVPYKETNIGTTQELTLINTTVTYIVPNQ